MPAANVPQPTRLKNRRRDSSASSTTSFFLLDVGFFSSAIVTSSTLYLEAIEHSHLPRKSSGCCVWKYDRGSAPWSYSSFQCSWPPPPFSRSSQRKAYLG